MRLLAHGVTNVWVENTISNITDDKKKPENRLVLANIKSEMKFRNRFSSDIFLDVQATKNNWDEILANSSKLKGKIKINNHNHL